MDKDITLEYQTITLEARNGNDASETFRERLPGFVTSVKDFIGGLLGRNATRPELVNLEAMQKALEGYNYAKASNIKVFVPTGLECTYAEYLEVLEMSQDAADRLKDGLLVPFNEWVNDMLSSPEELGSVRPAKMPRSMTFNSIDDIKEAHASCFDQSNALSERSFGDAFSRIKDVGDVEDATNDLVERLASIDRSDLAAATQTLSGSLSHLTKRIEENDDYSVSPRTTQVLADLIYRTAVEVEHFSVYAHSMEALVNSLKDTNEFVSKALSR